jgi:GH24 family phage-related lysozyme (muramidase)|tara:strand:- start:19 stop:879 length:861 start_codon:yes stop_codon:yes gene_type:complete
MTGLSSLNIDPINPKQKYTPKNPLASNFLKSVEGSISYQKSKGLYDPDTKEFIGYIDKEGKNSPATIGYGITNESESGFKVKPGQRITEYVADMSLDQEIEARAKVLNKLGIPKKYLENPLTRAAIISLDFNLGDFRKSDMLNEGLKKDNIDDFLFYAFSTKEGAGNQYLLKSKGLRNRRKKEKDLFLKGLKQIKKQEAKETPTLAKKEKEVEVEVSKAESPKSFKQAFAEARANKDAEFTYGGDRYNTRLKGETPQQYAAFLGKEMPVRVARKGGMVIKNYKERT